MVEQQSHWREGENLRSEIEQLVETPKIWGSLRRVPPGPGQAEAYRGDLRLAVPDNRLEARGPLTIHAYRETGGQVLIWLWAGNVALRRAHVGAGHGEPDRGAVLSGATHSLSDYNLPGNRRQCPNTGLSVECT